jgi:anti-sigma factor RsiW
MHQPIRENLEEYLKDSASEIPGEFGAHLRACGNCASELQRLKAQSRMLRSLQSPPDTEPRPGFYARVLERIEAQQPSMWLAFLDRKFGFRLAVASALLVALLGAYLVVTTQPSVSELASNPSVVLTDTAQPAEASIQEEGLAQERDAVLVDLASYHQ